VKVGFFNHPKTKLLRRTLGPEAVLSLLELWIYTAVNKPRGDLDGMTDDMIEMAANWTGDSGVFIGALRSIGFMKNLQMNDWKEHNGFAFFSRERSQISRMAAKKRWDVMRKGLKKKTLSGDAQSMPTACEGHNRGNAPSPAPLPLPLPLPSPDLKDKRLGENTPPVKKLFIKPTTDQIREYCTQRKNGIDAQYFRDYYDARGWLIGKNQMKDWQAAVRTWERNNRNNYSRPENQADQDDNIFPGAEIYRDSEN